MVLNASCLLARLGKCWDTAGPGHTGPSTNLVEDPLCTKLIHGTLKVSGHTGPSTVIESVSRKIREYFGTQRGPSGPETHRALISLLGYSGPGAHRSFFPLHGKGQGLTVVLVVATRLKKPKALLIVD
jgi:hypothetical protein